MCAQRKEILNNYKTLKLVFPRIIAAGLVQCTLAANLPMKATASVSLSAAPIPAFLKLSKSPNPSESGYTVKKTLARVFR